MKSTMIVCGAGVLVASVAVDVCAATVRAKSRPRYASSAWGPDVRRATMKVDRVYLAAAMLAGRELQALYDRERAGEILTDQVAALERTYLGILRKTIVEDGASSS